MVYGDFKDLPRRKALYKVLGDNIARKPKNDGYQRVIASMVDKFFDNKSTAGGAIKSKNLLNQQLAEGLHKSIIRKFQKRKVYYSSHKEKTWGADLADMQLTSKFNDEIRFLLFLIDIFS